MNEIEFLPTEEGVAAVVTKPDGEVTVEVLSLEQFQRLRQACEATE